MLRHSLVRSGLLLALGAALAAGPALAAPGRGGEPAARRAAVHRPLGAWMILDLLGLWPAKPGMIIDPSGVDLGMIIDPDGVDLPKEPGMIIDPNDGG